MSKLKKIVLFSGIGAITLAVIVITAVSLIRYGIYRSRFKDQNTQAQIEYLLPE